MRLVAAASKGYRDGMESGLESLLISRLIGLAGDQGPGRAFARVRAIPENGSDSDRIARAGLIPHDLVRLSSMKSQSRRNEFLEGRACLREIREEYETAGAFGAEAGLRLFLSLSHSHGLVLAVGWLGKEGESIGIDVEPSAREVSARVADWILPASERDACRRSPLEAWVLKEASLKSDVPRTGRLLSEYRFTADDAILGPGGTRFKLELIRSPGWLIALAQRRVDTLRN